MLRVELSGNADTRRALRAFAPDLEKELRTELRAALSPVVRKARGYVTDDSPMSGWRGRSFSEAKFPIYNPDTIRRNINYKVTPSKVNENGFSSMASIYNKSAAGAIYEIAGIKNPQGQPWIGAKSGSSSNKYSKSVNPKAGEQFIKNLPPIVSSLKGRGRLIYRAWADSRGVAEGAVMRAIDKAIREFYRRAETTTFRRAA